MLPNKPTYDEMILSAISDLAERKGSSIQAIKKYMGANYNVDVAKSTHFIKKSLESLTKKKAVTQTKGKGANGSFKLNLAEMKKTAKKSRNDANNNAPNFLISGVHPMVHFIPILVFNIE